MSRGQFPTGETPMGESRSGSHRYVGKNLPAFGAINFGYASAKRESTSAPHLLLEGYYDWSGLVREALVGPKFLFLGYKGSGKSALGEHLNLIGQGDPLLRVTLQGLQKLAFKEFARIVSGKAEPESKFPTTWSWLLYLTLINSLHHDEGARHQDPGRLQSTLAVLRALGLLPTPSLNDMVLVSSKQSFKAKIPPVMEANLERTFEKGQDLQLNHLVEHLEAVLLGFRTSSRHLLVIDDLDYILSGREVQYQVLSALITEADRLNQLLSQAQLPVKVIIVCRTDLFRRLPGPNKNKIMQDAGAHLDWYADPKYPEKSHLLKLVNTRARLSDEHISDVIGDYFPKGGRGLRKQLLDQTRHTPRDFIKLLRSIQECADARSVNWTRIHAGMRAYSLNYFYHEITDELDGYFTRSDIETGMQLLGSLRKRDFAFDELEAAGSKHPRYKDLDIPRFVEQLFEASAVGNVQQIPGGAFWHFRYRNRNSALNLDDRLVVHQGLWKALNVPTLEP